MLIWKKALCLILSNYFQRVAESSFTTELLYSFQIFKIKTKGSYVRASITIRTKRMFSWNIKYIQSSSSIAPGEISWEVCLCQKAGLCVSNEHRKPLSHPLVIWTLRFTSKVLISSFIIYKETHSEERIQAEHFLIPPCCATAVGHKNWQLGVWGEAVYACGCRMQYRGWDVKTPVKMVE